MKYLGLIGLALAVSSPVWAKQDFAAYEGSDAIQQGQGGTKVYKNGIDYWTTGAPPHRFQVLGVLTDARKDRAWDGDVIGSKSVAAKVLEAGGNAVIVNGAETQAVGLTHTGNAFAAGAGVFFSGHSRVRNRTTTQLIVVKYLD